MPMIFGFGEHRRQLLEAELERIRAELPILGLQRVYLMGEFAEGRVRPTSGLEFLVVQETELPFRSRPDFFTSHVLPRVGMKWHVYTPAEFDSLNEKDPVVIKALAIGEVIFAAE